ncbi:branched-chain amino acid ABC transporter permease [Variovorax paradoxus]|uniref:branched-chain amino acid ABC transporter permease n=1 Tax=Variovorax paradoxus TaxID=34073 RepID=UPI003ECF06F8
MELLNLFPQFLVNGLVNGASYVLVAVGLTLVFGILHIVNFAHGEFYMLGGYAAITASTAFGLPLIPALLVVVICMAAFGMLVERVVFQPLAKRDSSNAIIASFGLSVLLQNGALLVFGAQPRALKTDLAGIPVQFGSVFLTGQRLLIVVVTIAIVTALMLVLRFTWTGRALRAMAQHPTVAHISGVNVRKIAVITFAIAAAMAGVAGALTSSVFLVQPTSGAMLVMKAFTVVILGGMGSVGGAVIAGVGLGVIEAMVSGYIGNELRDMIGFFLVIAMLLIRPQGLLGQSTERS